MARWICNIICWDVSLPFEKIVLFPCCIAHLPVSQEDLTGEWESQALKPIAICIVQWIRIHTYGQNQ